MARALNQLKGGDVGAGRETVASLAVIVDELQGSRFRSEIVNWWTGYGSGEPACSINWLDGLDVSRARWLAVLSLADRGPA